MPRANHTFLRLLAGTVRCGPLVALGGWLLLVSMGGGAGTSGRAAEMPASDVRRGETKEVTISEFLRQAVEWGERVRVRTRGVVTLSLDDGTFFLMDEEAGLYVFHRMSTALRVGERVEVTGSPSLGGYSPTLQRCQVTRLGDEEEPQPVDLTERGEPLDGRHDMALVRVRGKVVHEPLTRALALWVEPELPGEALEVSLDRLSSLDPVRGMQRGSLVEVTGVCTVRRGAAGDAGELRVLLRSDRDLVLLKGPPFWTPARVSQGLGASVVGLVLALAWVWTLRRHVKRQTEAVTRRMEREAALLASEDRFLKVFRASPDPIAVVRQSDERILDVNPAFEDFFGYPRAEALGRTSDELAIWLRPDERIAALRCIRESGSVRNLECQLRTRSGRVVHVLGSAESIEWNGEKCLLSVSRDITERREKEEAARQMQAHLQQRQKMEALGTLAGGIAHDFNNILGAILGNVELAQGGLAGGDPAHVNLKEIRHAVLRARDLVRGVLTFSRQHPRVKEVVSLQPVVEEAVRLLRATIPATIEIRSDCQPGCPPILGVVSQIHQVLMNLGTNAWHAMEGKPGLMTVRLEPVMFAPGDTRPDPRLVGRAYACLSVSDTGSGVDVVTRERMFDPFFTTKGPGKGTGLGLAVVDAIVEDHGGFIIVESEPGRGTTFRLYFSKANPAEAALSPSGHEEERLADGGGLRVLFLDDEPMLARMAPRLFTAIGCQVSAFERPEDGLAAFAAAPGAFDAAVLDLTMPEMSGLEVARELRRQRPDLPVVLASGCVTDELRLQAERDGVRMILHKPYSSEELGRALGIVLRTSCS